HLAPSDRREEAADARRLHPRAVLAAACRRPDLSVPGVPLDERRPHDRCGAHGDLGHAGARDGYRSTAAGLLTGATGVWRWRSGTSGSTAAAPSPTWWRARPTAPS